MPLIQCERCLKTFKYQYLLKRHLNRKNPCKVVEFDKIDKIDKNVSKMYQNVSKMYPKCIQNVSGMYPECIQMKIK